MLFGLPLCSLLIACHQVPLASQQVSPLTALQAAEDFEIRKGSEVGHIPFRKMSLISAIHPAAFNNVTEQRLKSELAKSVNVILKASCFLLHECSISVCII